MCIEVLFIRYRDTVEQTICMFSRLIRANDIITTSPYTERTRFAKIIGANQAGKHARSLFNCISVTGDMEINEQNNPIATGLLYVQPEFDAFSIVVRGEIIIIIIIKAKGISGGRHIWQA